GDNVMIFLHTFVHSPVSNLSSHSQQQLPLLEDQATTSTFSQPQELDTGHHLNTQTDPDSFGAAHIGSIDVVNDSDTFLDHQLTPELSQTDLEQYNDLNAYLDTLKEDETYKKKKKKKKGRLPTICFNSFLFSSSSITHHFILFPSIFYPYFLNFILFSIPYSRIDRGDPSLLSRY
ncbi:hypothetical protein VP01_8783g1, partial [Puccinia sorghi]